MIRNREETKKKILQAVANLLAQKGFRSLGINAVAAEAGVDKVLIYRYFGGMPQLLKAFSQTSEFWPNFDEVVGQDSELFKQKPFDEKVETLTLNFVNALRHRPLTQEILAWETVEKGRSNAVLVEVRKQLGQRILREFVSTGGEADTDSVAIITLFAAAINYLVLRSRLDKEFNGIDIHSDKGWKRIEAAIGLICQRCLKSK